MRDNVNSIRARELFLHLFRKSWIMLISGIMFAMILYIAGDKMIAPGYESSTKIYILNRSEENSLTYADLTVSSSLTQDYGELVCSRNVMESVIAKLNLNYSEIELANMIHVSSESNDSRILKIVVTMNDPYQSYEVVNTVRDVAAEHIKNVMDIDSIQVVERAGIPEKKSSPNLFVFAGIGMILGIMIAAIVIVVLKVTNNTITTSEDIKQYLGLSVLGMIPNANAQKSRKKYDKKKHSKKQS